MRFTLLVLVCLLSWRIAEAQQSARKFTMEIDYLLYLPEDYEKDTTRNWPLMIFLHGSGEQGTDLEKVKIHGPPMLVEKGKEFPFLIASPQARRGWHPEILYRMIQGIIAENRVDKDRIYLTGLSMGGFGTWALAQEHPDLFAAIAPICGGGDTEDIWKLRHMPVWCFHGAKDNVVPLTASQKMVDSLKLYNPEVKFTIYPETGHDSWVQAYNDPELYEWFLMHEKFEFKEVDLDRGLLDDYVGEYVLKTGSFELLLEVFTEDNKLVGRMDEDGITMKPASDDIFFTEDGKTEIHFLRNADGEVDGIKAYNNRINVLHKIK